MIFALAGGILALGQTGALPAIDFEFDPLPFARLFVFEKMSSQPVADEMTKSKLTKALKEAFAIYPTKFLQENLRKITLLNRLEFNGHWYSGSYTVDPNVVVVVGKNEQGVLDTDQVRSIFHHELAHILAKTKLKALPTREWFAANAPGFQYKGSGYDAIAAGLADKNIDLELCAQGVLTTYSSYSFEEDFGVYAERYLTNDIAFMECVKRFPAVRKKAELIKGFYEKIAKGIKLPLLPKPGEQERRGGDGRPSI